MAGPTVRKAGVPAKPGSSRTSGTNAGEFMLLARIRKAVSRAGRGRGVEVGIGDDAAVVRPPAAAARSRSAAPKTRVTPALVLTTDTMVEGVHFEHGWLAPRDLGVRAFRAAVSDVAAMGARPLWVLLSLELPVRSRDIDENATLALVRAVSAEARRAGAALVGGNVSGSDRAAVTITVVGQSAGHPLLRSGATPGHLVFVTGTLGGSAAGCRELASQVAGSWSGSGTPQQRAAVRAFCRPPVRIEFAAAMADRTLAGAMIDVSDGLLQDLGHMAAESSVKIRLDPETIPVSRAARAWVERNARTSIERSHSPRASQLDSALELALTGGEDYELAFTAPPANRRAIEKLAATHRTPITVIGVVERGRPAVTDARGKLFAPIRGGFDHLRPRTRTGKPQP